MDYVESYYVESYRAHYTWVHRLAYKIVPELAEEVAQETFLRLLSQEQPPENLQSWLHTVMRNLAVSAYRDAKKRRGVDVEEHHAIIDACAPTKLQAQRALQAVAALPQGYRQALSLYVNGYKYSEIAHILGCAVGTVRSQIANARRTLTEQMR